MEIKPYIGIDSIEFGMNEDEVNRVAGDPHSTSYTIIEDDVSVVENQTRNKINYQFQGGRLACITFDSKALSGNNVLIMGKRMPFTRLELLRFLKQISKEQVQIRFPTAYLYNDLGIVLYTKRIMDIRMGIDFQESRLMMAVCNRPVFAAYVNYFLENMKQTENIDTQLFDALQLFIEECDNSEDTSY